MMRVGERLTGPNEGLPSPLGLLVGHNTVMVLDFLRSWELGPAVAGDEHVRGSLFLRVRHLETSREVC